MLRRLATMGLAGAVALTGCGGGGNGGGGGATTAPTTASPTPTFAVATDAQLKTALLAASDLPAGWKVVPPDGEEDDDFGDECKPLAALDSNKLENTEVEVEFAKGEQPPFLNQAVVSLASPEAVTAEMQSYDKAFAACPSFTSTDEDGEKVQVTVAPLSFPKLGDESISYRLTATLDGGKIVFDFVIARVRNHAMVMAGTSITSPIGSGTISSSELGTLAQKAVDKVSSTLP